MTKNKRKQSPHTRPVKKELRSDLLPREKRNLLKNKKVLITAGPTREYLDPVRYLTNASSGQMGICLAQEAARLGAKVTLVLGPTTFDNSVSFHRSIQIVPVVSGWEMYNAVKKYLTGIDIFVGCAAVSDYRPLQPETKKMKRTRPQITMTLSANPDIIAMVGHHETDRPQHVIGFALETNDLLKNAAHKLVRKKLDWIVANQESNLGSRTGEATLLSRWGDRIPLKKTSKDKLAQLIWKNIFKK